MKRYLAYYHYWRFSIEFEKMTIQEIEVEKETPKMFYWKGQRHYKKYYDAATDEFYCYYKTAEEARLALIIYIQGLKCRKIDELQNKIKELENAEQKLSKDIPAKS